MTLLTRAAKGAPLTNNEGDANWAEVEARLQGLERPYASSFADPRSPRAFSARLLPGGLTREPCFAPGEVGAVFAFPASSVSGAQVTLHEWQRDTTLLADTVTVLPRALPISTPGGGAISTGANVTVVTLTQRSA